MRFDLRLLGRTMDGVECIADATVYAKDETELDNEVRKTASSAIWVENHSSFPFVADGAKITLEGYDPITPASHPNNKKAVMMSGSQMPPFIRQAFGAMFGENPPLLFDNGPPEIKPEEEPRHIIDVVAATCALIEDEPLVQKVLQGLLERGFLKQDEFDFLKHHGSQAGDKLKLARGLVILGG